MIKEIQALSRRLKEAFPDGYVVIRAEIWQHHISGKEETVWSLSIEQIQVREEYPTWDELKYDALYLLGKQEYKFTKLKEGTIMFSDIIEEEL